LNQKEKRQTNGFYPELPPNLFKVWIRLWYLCHVVNQSCTRFWKEKGSEIVICKSNNYQITLDWLTE